MKGEEKERRKVVCVSKQRIDRNNHSPSVFRRIRLIEAWKVQGLRSSINIDTSIRSLLQRLFLAAAAYARNV